MAAEMHAHTGAARPWRQSWGVALPCPGGGGARDPAPMADARGRRCPAWAAEPHAGGCGPAPVAEARRSRCQAPAAEPRASGAARRLRQRARWRARLGAGRRRYSGGRGRPTVADPQAGAAGPRWQRHKRARPAAAADALAPALYGWARAYGLHHRPAHDFFFIFRYQLNVESLLVESLVLYNFSYNFLSL